MLFDKYLNSTFLRAPDVEAGSPEPAGGAPPAGGGERRSIRDELRAQFDEARDDDAPPADADRDRSGRFRPRKAAAAESAPAEGSEAGAEEAPAEPAAAPEGGEEAPAEQPPITAEPPRGWPKDAKEAWSQLPAAVQAAVIKRETDTQKGVDELKSRYADMDAAIQPHAEAIRSNGHTNAQAVAQLFGWFQALAHNPKVAFPALARSFNIDLGEIVGTPRPAAPAAPAADPAAPAPAADAAPGGLPPELQSLRDVVQQMAAKMSGLEQTFEQTSHEKTKEVLQQWAKDKPHFEEVRGLMAQLVQSGAVPLKEGRVDLDGAYEMAVYARPDVRAKVLADQQAAAKAAADKKAADAAAARQRDADRARRTGRASLAPAAPGAAAPAGQKPVKGKSVRESLKEAIAEATA